MNYQQIIDNTITYVQNELAYAEGGHDWWHISRVWKLAKQLAQTEPVDQLVIELGALLHDIADSKFHDGDETIGPKKARVFLESLGLEEDLIVHIEGIIKHISFKGGHREPNAFSSAELDLIRDADRLDAMGAVGIARTFNYGGFKNRGLYDPACSPNLNMTREEYKNSTAPTINHFYEKLLLLKDQMSSPTAKRMAEHRHAYMVAFLEEFYAEWNGER